MEARPPRSLASRFQRRKQCCPHFVENYGNGDYVARGGVWLEAKMLPRGIQCAPAQSLPGDPDWWTTGGPGYKSFRTRGDTHTAGGLYVDLGQTFDFIGRGTRVVHRQWVEYDDVLHEHLDDRIGSLYLQHWRGERQADQAAIWRGRRHRAEAGGKDRHDRAWDSGIGFRVDRPILV